MNLEKRYDQLCLDREFIEEAVRERKALNCVQSRAAFVGHKLGLKSLAFKWVDETNAQLVTGCQDQSCKLYVFPVPDPNADNRAELIPSITEEEIEETKKFLEAESKKK